MGASRKLQGEIDRVLKKVQEGVDVFDSIWNKVYDTDNANQKEKFEADLKKEIKKLQRYRDQIKTWIQSSEIKDKKVSASYEQALVDARKLIEREMERFKICEKETKTKAFSKEGLGQQPKTDPREKAKSETRDWINNVVNELENQIDIFESEIESLSVKKGKSRPPRLTHLEASIVRHKAHVMKLELILRLLDNDELSPEQVNDVKDFLDDYMERNQESFDEFTDVDDLYNTLPLDKVETLEEIVNIGPPSLSKAAPLHNTKPSVGTVPALSSPVEDDGGEMPENTADSVSQQSGTTPAVSPTGPPSPAVNIPNTVSVPTPAQSPAPIASPSPVLSRASSDSFSTSAPPSPAPTPNVAKEEDSAALRRLPESGIGKGIGRGGLPVVSVNNPLPPVPLTSDSTKRTMVGIDERLGSGSVQPLSSPVPNRIPLSQAGKLADTSAGIETNAPADAAAIGARVFSPSLVSNMQWRPGSSFQNPNEPGQVRTRTEIPPDHREKFLQRYQQVQQGSNMLGNLKPFSSPQIPLLSQFNPQTSSVSSLPVSTAPSQPPVSQPVSKDSESAQPKSEESQNVQDESASDSLPKEDEMKSSYSSDMTVGSLTEPDLSPGQVIQPNQPINPGIIGRRSAPDLGAIGESISGPAVPSGAMHDQHYQLQMLEAGFHKLPQPRDSDRPRTYTPKHPAGTPASYPQVQAPIVNNPAFWERQTQENFATDTLFFAFYYQQSTYQQYLAAKELKKQSWRYHRKYNTWFQRHEEPKVATDEFEQGTYVYFDFHVGIDDIQHGWCQRIKTDFTFEYNYLEDELLA